ncbi:MAG: pyridoxamine 5'-phosphate oxidase family protein [Bacteroidetes bacterium]|nr:pyridoxamine 5'-phosphate oxidase family protein [Fibrella sp.]
MDTTTPFHAGELAVQARTGEEQTARRNGQIIAERIPNGALNFVNKQPMVVASSVDANQRIWTSLLAGMPGFVVAETPSLINLDTNRLVSARDDIFWANVANQPAVGLLFIELRSRRRLRVNGRMVGEGSQYRMTVGEAFANCPQYIQRREMEVTAPHVLPDSPAANGTELPDELTRWIERADTFFVGSAHDAEHIDTSHRGGKPGFVRVENARTLLVPDYRGNSMFNTLGNLAVNPVAGLLFINFDMGESLQLTGRAELLFGEPGQADDTGGTGRHWRFHSESWRRQTSLRSVDWTFVEYSPYNV